MLVRQISFFHLRRDRRNLLFYVSWNVRRRKKKMKLIARKVYVETDKSLFWLEGRKAGRPSVLEI